MDTLKTGVVVILLLAVLYGVYVALNRGEPQAPPEFSWANQQSMEAPPVEISPPAGEAGTAERPAPLPGSAPIPRTPQAPGGGPRPLSAAGGPTPGQPAALQPAYGGPGATSGRPTPEDAAFQPPPPPPGFQEYQAGQSGGASAAGGADTAGGAPAAATRLPTDSATPPDLAAARGSTRGAAGGVDPAAAGSSYSPSGNGGTTGGAGGPTPPPSTSQYAPPAATPGGVDLAAAERTEPAPSDSRYPSPPQVTPRDRTQIIDNPTYNGRPSDASPSGSRYGGGAAGPQRPTFDALTEQAQGLVQQAKWRDALQLLSRSFGDPTHTPQQQRRLLDMLDPLAAKVIYSPEHNLETAYRVQRGEDLLQIARKHQVPYQLLKNINGVRDPKLLTPGETLKVVKGPFRAEVDLTRRELVLFLGDLYAGRFPITVGGDPSPRDGEYTVRGKELGRTYYGPNNVTLPPNHPNNPFGRYWMDLGGDVSLHGSAPSGDNRGMGCISLSPIDAGDVYGILTVGSKVTIRR